ncbi:unnamed protein product [Linum trigynum]
MGSNEFNVVGKATRMINPMNSDEFRRQGHMFIDFIADYYSNIEQYPVTSRVKPGYLRELLPQSAPFDAEPMEEIMKDIQTHIIPGSRTGSTLHTWPTSPAPPAPLGSSASCSPPGSTSSGSTGRRLRPRRSSRPS